MKKLLITASLLMLTQAVFAQEPAKEVIGELLPEMSFLNEPIKIRSMDTEFIKLDRGFFIDRISFQAKKCGLGTSDKGLQLSLDGYNSYGVNVSKNSWRTYTATFSNYGRVVEVKSTYTSGCVEIRNLKVLPRRYYQAGGNHHPMPVESDAFQEVDQLKMMVDFAYHRVSASDRVQYLDKLTLTLSNALTVLETSSSMSMDSRKAIVDVIAELDRIQPFIEALMQTPQNADMENDGHQEKTKKNDYSLDKRTDEKIKKDKQTACPFFYDKS